MDEIFNGMVSCFLWNFQNNRQWNSVWIFPHWWINKLDARLDKKKKKKKYYHYFKKEFWQKSCKFYDSEMHFTCWLLDHNHAFHFFLPSFINKIHCFLASLRHTVKIKKIVRCLTEWTFDCVEQFALRMYMDIDIMKKRQGCIIIWLSI